MATVVTWTGREANALRQAMRLSVTDFADHLGAARRTVVKWGTRGTDIRPRPDMQAALDTVLARASDDVRARFDCLRVARTGGAPEDPANASISADPAWAIDHEPSELTADRQDGVVRRRDVLSGLGKGAIGPAMTQLLDLLFVTEPASDAVSVRNLTEKVAAVKTDYQGCRYTRVLDQLTALLPSMEAARARVDDAHRTELEVAATDLYHVLGSVLLKSGDREMALVAAERSSRSGVASGDPLAVGTSARIMTHAVMSNGHPDQAVRLARAGAARLEQDVSMKSAEAIAVFGALLLRGAIAAARAEDKSTAQDMLDEAGHAAAHMGADGNDRWTGFGPTNVLLHRVNVALCFGDAGTAIAIAREVPLERIRLAERKATLLLDVAQAYTQWGKHEQGLRAIRAAYHVAPEEIRTRPTAHRVLGDLAALSRGRVRTDVAAFASQAGICCD
jgi:dihydroxyacetone kinase DhaKLM complex PTS-EIIA-like component DhaM